jgi:uncharacterized protein (DUF427 family)
MKALWNGETIAVSDKKVVVEQNHYFPPNFVNQALLKKNSETSICPWKGEATYINLVVDGKTNPSAVWSFPKFKDTAKEITEYYSFWKGIGIHE